MIQDMLHIHYQKKVLMHLTEMAGLEWAPEIRSKCSGSWSCPAPAGAGRDLP